MLDRGLFVGDCFNLFGIISVKDLSNFQQKNSLKHLLSTLFWLFRRIRKLSEILWPLHRTVHDLSHVLKRENFLKFYGTQSQKPWMKTFLMLTLLPFLRTTKEEHPLIVKGNFLHKELFPQVIIRLPKRECWRIFRLLFSS